MTEDDRQAAIEEGWRNCVGYLSEGPSETTYLMDVPERTGAHALRKEFAHVRQLGLTGKEPETRIQMLDRFAPMEQQVIDGVERLMKAQADPRTVTRLVVQAILNGPKRALEEMELQE